MLVAFLWWPRWASPWAMVCCIIEIRGVLPWRGASLKPLGVSLVVCLATKCYSVGKIHCQGSWNISDWRQHRHHKMKSRTAESWTKIGPESPARVTCCQGRGTLGPEQCSSLPSHEPTLMICTAPKLLPNCKIMQLWEFEAPFCATVVQPGQSVAKKKTKKKHPALQSWKLLLRKNYICVWWTHVATKTGRELQRLGLALQSALWNLKQSVHWRMISMQQQKLPEEEWKWPRQGSLFGIIVMLTLKLESFFLHVKLFTYLTGCDLCTSNSRLATNGRKRTVSSLIVSEVNEYAALRESQAETDTSGPWYDRFMNIRMNAIKSN